MADQRQSAFGLRAFVCMADLLFGLSAGVLFLNAQEAEDLDSLPVLIERKTELERAEDELSQGLAKVASDNQSLHSLLKDIENLKQQLKRENSRR